MGIIRQEEIKQQAIKITRQAGNLLLSEYKKGRINHLHFKSKHEIATAADLISEKIILKALNKLTPDYRIISEEKGDSHKKSDWLWLVDPLDGTTNFYMGNPLFAVQIALVYKNEPQLSLIFAPAINEFYSAEKGKGSYLNNKKIKVSKNKLNHALLTYCHGNGKSDLEATFKIYKHYKTTGFDIRQIGSAALEFGWVAKGRTDCYISPNARLWDIVPGSLLVQEAGGKVYDFKGNPWNLKSKTAFASNDVIDQPILKFLKTL
jgi:myo-inositol-1(or 4)-monophosphatase